MIPKTTKLPAAELTEDVEEEVPETPEAPRRASRSGSPLSGLRETASLISLIQANMREQSDRIGHLQQTHEQHNTILSGIIEDCKALMEIVEDHTASLEEALERMETLAAAYIRMIEHQTNQNRQRETTTQPARDANG